LVRNPPVAITPLGYMNSNAEHLKGIFIPYESNSGYSNKDQHFIILGKYDF